MLTANGIYKDYKYTEVLRNINWRLEKGVFGLIGPNGAGKTTLLKIVTGCEAPSDGDVFIDDLSLKQFPDAFRNNIGYLPQHFSANGELTVKQSLHYVAVMKGIQGRAKRSERIERCLEDVNLTDQTKTKVKALSTGLLQRLGIAQALINEPNVLVLDEPTAGLDPVERVRFRKLIAQYGKSHTVLLSTHIMTDISDCCCRVGIMKNGRLLFKGSPSELTHSAAGKVWAVTEEAPTYLDKQRVLLNRDKGNYTYRVITPDQPASAQRLSPTMMDGYLAVVGSPDYA